MGWITCVGCKKLQRDIEARSFLLIAPIQYVLHQLSCTYETIPNAPKYYQTHRNNSIGSHFAPSFMQLRNDPKCIQTLRYSPKLEFRVPWGGRGAFVAKMSDTTWWHELFSLIVAVQPKLHRVWYNTETIPNAPKHYETNQKKSLLSNGLDQVRSLLKCPTQPRGTYFFQ